MLADSGYTFLDVMWSMFVFFAWILWFWMLLYIYTDLFRRDDIGGWVKTGWVVFTIFLPIIGCFTYLIVEGRAMSDRRAEEARRARSDMDTYVRSVASDGAATNSPAAQIERAKELLENGAITQEEFQTLKRRALTSAA